jgi:OPA family glycerol-3-phosphate transporter-like MFS transporter
MTSTPDTVAFTRWQWLIGSALLLGYAGYYVCRSNLSVVVPLLTGDAASGLTRDDLGLITSAGIVAYALGKTITGVAADFLGGRVLFLGGLFLSVLATVAFASSAEVPALLLIWTFNRFVQSAGWGGLTKTAAHWYSAERYGTVMSVLSLSYLFGDASGRYVLGVLLSGGLGWRAVFLVSAVLLATIGLFGLVTLRDSPRQLGFPEPAVRAGNLFGGHGTASRPANLPDLLHPYLRSLSFWLVCGIAFGMTLIREAFNTWIPSYLVDAHQLAPGTAAEYSAVFPLIGGVSALAVGALTDRLKSHRAGVMVPAMACCTLSLGLLVVGTTRHDLWLSLFGIGAIAFSLLGPYTLLAGAIALDLGGRKGSATAAGLIDTAGYAGGTLSGVAIGRLVETRGWAAAFTQMGWLAAAVTVVALFYWLEHRRRLVWRAAPQPELT